MRGQPRRRMTAAQYRLIGHRALPEAELQERVRAVARLHGLRYYHTHDSRRSPAGFPDVVLAGPGGVAFIELKREGGRLTPAQRDWLDVLQSSGQVAFMARPGDFERIVEVCRALAQPRRREAAAA